MIIPARLGWLMIGHFDKKWLHLREVIGIKLTTICGHWLWVLKVVHYSSSSTWSLREVLGVLSCHAMHGICRDALSRIANFHVCTACGRSGHRVQVCPEAGSGNRVGQGGRRAHHMVHGGSAWSNLGM